MNFFHVPWGEFGLIIWAFYQIGWGGSDEPSGRQTNSWLLNVPIIR